MKHNEELHRKLQLKAIDGHRLRRSIAVILAEQKIGSRPPLKRKVLMNLGMAVRVW